MVTKEADMFIHRKFDPLVRVLEELQGSQRELTRRSNALGERARRLQQYLKVTHGPS